MNVQHFEERLRSKEQELVSQIGGLESNARNAGQDEVGDNSDRAIAEEEMSTNLLGASALSETLEQVQDALNRIKNGTYGTCIGCGRQIEPARLEAIPWTPYCLDDQAKLDS